MSEPLASSANGRTSGKPWKIQKSATVRSQQSAGHCSKSWEDRMQKTQKAQAIKKLQSELKKEKEDELTRRREITKERKLATAERIRIAEEKATMGARKAARRRRREGRTKKINH